jgi:hypothetical protein
MNAQSIDLITLRMIIRSTRKNMTDIRRDTTQTKEFERLAKLMEKYQAWHIQKTGELYYG